MENSCSCPGAPLAKTNRWFLQVLRFEDEMKPSVACDNEAKQRTYLEHFYLYFLSSSVHFCFFS